MNEEERRVIVDQEMVKALKFLTDAEELARLEMWNVVANRAYYALYHAVMAMMVNDGFLPKTQWPYYRVWPGVCYYRKN